MIRAGTHGCASLSERTAGPAVITTALPSDRIRRLLAPSVGGLPLQTARCAAVLRRFTGIRAVVFDFYDTLVLSEARPPAAGLTTVSILSAPFLQLLHKSGAAVPAQASEVESVVAQAVRDERARLRLACPGLVHPEVDLREVWRTAFGMAEGPAEWVEEAIARWGAWTTRTCTADGAALALALLRSRDILLGLGSNAQFLAPSLFTLHFGSPPERCGFDENLCVWSVDLGVGKPDPAFFAEIATRAKGLGLSPREILFVGNDPARDIDPAREAGFATCLYAGDARCLRPATAIPAEAVITHFEQLGELV